MLAAALDVNRSHKNKQSSTHLKQLGEDLGEDDEEDDKQEERGRKRDITVESESRGMSVQAVVSTVLESIKTLKVTMPDTEQEAIIAAEVLLKELERYTAMLTESLMVKVSN